MLGGITVFPTGVRSLSSGRRFSNLIQPPLRRSDNFDLPDEYTCGSGS